jgi:hypothetical protein
VGYSASNVGIVLSDELVGMERQSYDSFKDLFLHLVGQEETIQTPLKIAGFWHKNQILKIQVYESEVLITRLQHCWYQTSVTVG